jgi:hypothetical protein
MFGDASFGCVFRDADGFDLPNEFNDNVHEVDPDDREDDDSGLNGISYPSIPGQKTAVGNALSLIGKAMDDANKKYKMNFTGVPMTGIIDYPGTDDPNYQVLYGWKFRNRSGKDSYIVINTNNLGVSITNPDLINGTYTMLAGNPREYMVGDALTPSTTPTINLVNENTITTPNQHVPYKFTGTVPTSGTFEFKPYSITYIDGPAPNTLVFDVYGPCGVAYTQIVYVGNNYTLKVEGGVGPYKFTSNFPVSISGNLNITSTPNDNVEIQAYLPNGYTSQSVIFTAQDLGRPSTAAATFTVTVKAKKTVGITVGAVPAAPGTLGITTYNTCNANCVTLSASNIDLTTSDNRYEWYPIVDGTLSSTTGYGKNGYAQTVTVCPNKPNQTYTVIAYSGTECDYATQTITVNSIIANANPVLNDDVQAYICNAPPSNLLTLGTPATPQLGEILTYNWTGPGINAGNQTQPKPQVTLPGIYVLNVYSNLQPSCSKTSTIQVVGYTCCVPGSGELKFPPYTHMNEVVDAILVSCPGCVNSTKTVVSNYPGNLLFNGPVIMDDDDRSVSFYQCNNLKFAENAKLSVRDGKTLLLDRSILNSCNSIMWKGIELRTAQEEVKIRNASVIKNAKIGVDASNNALVTVQSSTFDRNHKHLSFTKYGGNAVEVSDEADKEKGIVRNIFTHTPGNLLAPYATTNRTYADIYFDNCLGSVRIGGDNASFGNGFGTAVYNIYATGSGLNVTNNKQTTAYPDYGFKNFQQGIWSIMAKPNITYIAYNNSFSSNYAFNDANWLAENKGTAIYISASADVTPDSISISNNIIDRCRQGIFISKIAAINTSYNLAGLYGGEVKNNTITLYKPEIGNEAVGNYDHKAMVLMQNKALDVVANNISTNNGTILSLTPVTRVDAYTGIECSGQGINCDFFDNNFTSFGKMFSVVGSNGTVKLKCNDFYRGSRNYEGTSNTTGIIGMYFNSGSTLGPQGTTTLASGNTWTGFTLGTNYKRASRNGAGALISYFYYNDPDPDNRHNPNNVSVFDANTSPNDPCTSYIAIAENQDNGEHQTNDITKDGELDSLSLATYEPIYDSTETVNDLYTDADNLLLALEAVEAGNLDSATVYNNFENSVVYQVYTLETAMAASDSAAITTAVPNLPHDVVGDNYTVVANIAAKSTPWDAIDSVNLVFTAYQRVDEGGPSVINARNMLGIYVDDATIAPKSNRNAKRSGSGILLSVIPNPNTGKFSVYTNLPPATEIKIYDVLGNLVYQNKLFDAITPIDIENFNNGLYHLTAIDPASKLKSVSFVINK